jgi:xanthine dehydrogenase accessory factor
MEQRRIVRLWQQGDAGVLATLVRVEGSSYRRPGARLLISKMGECAGAISGGCLEADVVRRAAWMVQNGAVVERYSTALDDLAEIPFGLGCGGTLDLLLEPADTVEFGALMEAAKGALEGRGSKVVTWLPGNGKALRRVVIGADGEVVFASPGLGEEKIGCACGLEAGTEYEGRFVEEMRPPQRLFVLGAGDDAKPLVSMAALLGWSVTVADGRAQMARMERFPEADRVIVLGPELENFSVSALDAVVVMTHSFEQDRELLARVLPMWPRYLGLLGARHRSSHLIREAAEILGWSVSDCCNRVYAPVGLDLGGDGAEAIALAVIAEAQACCQGKLGASRRLTAEDVAEQIAHGSVAGYLQVQCTL